MPWILTVSQGSLYECVIEGIFILVTCIYSVIVVTGWFAHFLFVDLILNLQLFYPAYLLGDQPWH